MREHLRAGIAIHNAGYHHAAHDAWEDRWLAIKEGVGGSTASPETVPDLPDGVTDPTPAADERLLHGLIQFTAAAFHLERDNPAGARGLAERAGGYLAPLAADYRAVNVESVREYLARIAADPAGAAGLAVPDLTHEGRALSLADLAFPATGVAATVLAEELEPYDEAVLERAVAYAREDLAAGDDSRFLALVGDFVRDDEQRALVYDRLESHVERRRAKERDVEGLFDPE
jgi:predicted metal-dependent hydrolase